MTQLSAERNTMELGAPRRVLVAGGQIYAGAMVAVKAADGLAYPASNTTGIVVVGRAEHTAATGETLTVRSGIFCYDNNAEEITAKEIGTKCYVVDDQTVTKTANDAEAGTVYAVDGDGVWVKID